MKDKGVQLLITTSEIEIDISGDLFFEVSIEIYKTDSERDSDKFSNNMYLISDMQTSLVVVIFFV